MAWRYYDFDANWDTVYKVWQGDAVQDELERAMLDWCEGHPIPHMRQPRWHRGDSLWQYSNAGNYHGERSMEAANKLVNDEDVFGQLMAALRRHGLDLTEEQLCESDIFDRAFAEYERRCEPKDGTLESLILWAGDHCLEGAHSVLASELFPEERIIVAQPPGSDVYEYARVFLCKQRLVFDFMGYWWYKQGDESAACPQPHV